MSNDNQPNNLSSIEQIFAFLDTLPIYIGEFQPYEVNDFGNGLHPTADSYERSLKLLENVPMIEITFPPDVLESARKEAWDKIQNKKAPE